MASYPRIQGGRRKHLVSNRLPSAFYVPAYDDLSDASDSDYEITDDWVETIEWL